MFDLTIDLDQSLQALGMSLADFELFCEANSIQDSDWFAEMADELEALY
jgi:hypothetical protein